MKSIQSMKELFAESTYFEILLALQDVVKKYV